MPGSTEKWQAVYSLIIKAGSKRVRVGVFDGVNGATGETAEIATIHEYGAPRANIPERSYIRSTLAERKAELSTIMARVVKAMIARTLDEHRGLELVGAWLANAVKTRIVSGPFTPLKPATIARKGSDKPLIDTAQLKGSVGFVIVD